MQHGRCHVNPNPHLSLAPSHAHVHNPLNTVDVHNVYIPSYGMFILAASLRICSQYRLLCSTVIWANKQYSTAKHAHLGASNSSSGSVSPPSMAKLENGTQEWQLQIFASAVITRKDISLVVHRYRNEGQTCPTK